MLAMQRYAVWRPGFLGGSAGVRRMAPKRERLVPVPVAGSGVLAARVPLYARRGETEAP
jgi:hypothetical protein